MSELENLVNKAKELCGNIANKTNETVGTVQLKAEISKAKKELEKKYTTLGEAYYNIKKSGEERDFSEQFNEINDCILKIQQLEDSLYEKQGYKKCAECGVYTEKDSSFCQNCGKKF